MHLIVTSGELAEQKIITFKEEDKIGYMNLTYDDLEKDIQTRQQYLQFFKSGIAQTLKVKEDDIHIFGIQKGSKKIVFQVIDNITGSIRNYTDSDIKELEKYFGNASTIDQDYSFQNFKIRASDLDTQFNMEWGPECQDMQDNRGGFPYYFPVGWKGLALKVSGLYDNQNDQWLAMDGNSNEWCVLYHGTNSIEQIIRSDKNSKIKPGQRQWYKDEKCLITKKQIGVGVYFSNHIEVCENYSKGPDGSASVQLGDSRYLVVFQCRVNPPAVRQIKKQSDLENKIGQPQWDNDFFVINRPEDIRPYRILIKQIQ